jgi:hypothetical protein
MQIKRDRDGSEFRIINPGQRILKIVGKQGEDKVMVLPSGPREHPMVIPPETYRSIQSSTTYTEA